MNPDAKIFVTGHNGLVGSAVVRELALQGCTNILTANRTEVDLSDPVAVKWFFSVYEPEYVFACAARVGGILANSEHPVDFFTKNIAIQNNVILNAAVHGVKKLLFLGSSCVYPRDCPQPIKEEYLLTGPLEPTNEAYALAKISGIKLCQWLRKERGLNFVSAMPCNLYGRQDNFDPHNAHIIPGLIARLHEAKISNAPVFDVWGRPDTLREYLFSDDLARALIYVMKYYDDPEPINTGSSMEMTVEKLAQIIAAVVGYSGELRFDDSIPAGTPRKLLDNAKIYGLGWVPVVNFKNSLELTYDWYVNAKRNNLLRPAHSK